MLSSVMNTSGDWEITGGIPLVIIGSSSVTPSSRRLFDIYLRGNIPHKPELFGGLTMSIIR
jgi:hypothetical protein